MRRPGLADFRQRMDRAVPAVSRLIAGRVFSRVGDGIYEVALLWVAIHLLREPWAVAGLVVVGNGVSTAVMPVAGHAVDRFQRWRRALAVAADAGGSLLFGVAALVWPMVSSRYGYPALLVMTGINAITASFLFPALGALWASVLQGDDRQRGNSAWQGAQAAANFGGLVLGGILVSIWSFRAILAAQAASFLMGALCTATVPTPPVQSPSYAPRTAGDAWRELAKNGAARRLIVVSAVLNGSLVVLTTLVPFLVVRDLHAKAFSLGVVQAVLAGGLVAGGYASRWLERWPPVEVQMAGGFVALAGFMLVLAFRPSVAATVAVMLLVGVAASALSVSWMTWSQGVVGEDQYGKFLAASSTLTTVTQPTRAAASGVAATAVGVSLTLAATGAGLAGSGAALFFGTRKRAESRRFNA